MKKSIREKARNVPIAGEYDVIVCGGGPAGVAAAVSSSKSGAKTLLVEKNGCLGGIWTAGLMSHIIDADGKQGVLKHIMDTLARRGAKGLRNTYNIEPMKLLLEEMCDESGVDVRLYTRVVGAHMDSPACINAVITESKSGREAWRAGIHIDSTGDGDLAAFAGCGFDVGRSDNAEFQPMSLTCLVTGLNFNDLKPFLLPIDGPKSHKKKLLDALIKAGRPPSYGSPTFFHLNDHLYVLMSNHEYAVPATDAAKMTAAAMKARRELNAQIAALRSLGGIWKNIEIIATAEQIGVREGRRIHGRYLVTKDDMIAGKKHADAVCRCAFGVDIHSTNPEKSRQCYSDGIKVKPYDIPLRALLAKDVDNLLMAGRCISGDFFAHASYRVTGNAVAMGEAIGKYAAARKFGSSKEYGHGSKTAF